MTRNSKPINYQPNKNRELFVDLLNTYSPDVGPNGNTTWQLDYISELSWPETKRDVQMVQTPESNDVTSGKEIRVDIVFAVIYPLVD